MKIIKSTVEYLPMKKVGFFSKSEEMSDFQNDLIEKYVHLESIRDRIKTTIDIMINSNKDENYYFPLSEPEMCVVREFMETNRFTIEKDIDDCENQFNIMVNNNDDIEE